MESVGASDRDKTARRPRKSTDDDLSLNKRLLLLEDEVKRAVVGEKQSKAEVNAMRLKLQTHDQHSSDTIDAIKPSSLAQQWDKERALLIARCLQAEEKLTTLSRPST